MNTLLHCSFIYTAKSIVIRHRITFFPRTSYDRRAFPQQQGNDELIHSLLEPTVTQSRPFSAKLYSCVSCSNE